MAEQQIVDSVAQSVTTHYAEGQPVVTAKLHDGRVLRCFGFAEDRSAASEMRAWLLWLALALVLVGCGGAPFEAGLALQDALAADVDGSGGAEAGATSDGGGEVDGALESETGQVDVVPTDCPVVTPPSFELWAVSADGGLANGPGDCQGFVTPVGDSYSCASITSNWTCPWQSAGQPSILLWCRNPDIHSTLVIVGCLR